MPGKSPGRYLRGEITFEIDAPDEFTIARAQTPQVAFAAQNVNVVSVDGGSASRTDG